MATTEVTEVEEVMANNPIITPKELPSSPSAEAATLLPKEVLQDNSISDEDDDCVICYQTLYRPAKTTCSHLACESCMLHWALTAMAVSPSDTHLSTALSITGMKFKCPTCRTYTSATFDATRDETLSTRYATEYAARAAELVSDIDAGADSGDEYASQTMILMTGNSHRKVPPSVSPYTGIPRTHEFTFFVQSSRQNVIEQVDVILHPTFRQDRLVLLHEMPFSTTHLAWGYFTVFAGVTLKKGWEWVGEERVVDSDVGRGRCKDRLPVEWMLDFGGDGSQRNRLVKFRKVKEESDSEKVEEGTGGNGDEDEGEDDLTALAELMSESEIKQLRNVRRLKRLRERQASIDEGVSD